MGRKWCILRCAGRSTLPLAASLAEDGYEVWTPVAYLDRDKPSSIFPSRAQRKRSTEPVTAPIVPTYVFADLEHLLDLLALSETQVQRHEGFSVMRRPSGFAMVREGELLSLRKEETRHRPKVAANPKSRHDIAKRYGVGERVLVPTSGGSFVGLQGEVEASDGRYTDLYFGGSMRLKIETFKLRGDDVSEADLIAA